MSDLYYLLLLAMLGSFFGLIGGFVVLFSKRLSRVLESNSIPFAAGVLITVALLGLLPEAVEMGGESAYLIVLISFLATYFFEQVFLQLHHHGDHHHEHGFSGSAAVVIVGDSIHNLIDGITIGATFLVSPGLGLVTAVSTFLHEVPHEIADFGILLRAGWEKRNIVLVNLGSAAATILGALVVYFVDMSDSLVGVLLGVSAGIFLYLGASDFLPHIADSKENKFRAIAPLVLGVLVMSVLLVLVE